MDGPRPEKHSVEGVTIMTEQLKPNEQAALLRAPAVKMSLAVSC